MNSWLYQWNQRTGFVFWTRIMLTKSLSPAVQSISSQSIGGIFFRTFTDKSKRFLNLKRDSKCLKKGP